MSKYPSTRYLPQALGASFFLAPWAFLRTLTNLGPGMLVITIAQVMLIWQRAQCLHLGLDPSHQMNHKKLGPQALHPTESPKGLMSVLITSPLEGHLVLNIYSSLRDALKWSLLGLWAFYPAVFVPAPVCASQQRSAFHLEVVCAGVDTVVERTGGAQGVS